MSISINSALEITVQGPGSRVQDPGSSKWTESSRGVVGYRGGGVAEGMRSYRGGGVAGWGWGWRRARTELPVAVGGREVIVYQELGEVGGDPKDAPNQRQVGERPETCSCTPSAASRYNQRQVGTISGKWVSDQRHAPECVGPG